MASEHEIPAHILFGQGQDVDATQNMRLNYARDPVFAHLATFATAAAINGLRINIVERQNAFHRLTSRHPFMNGRRHLAAAYQLEGRSPARNPWRLPTLMERVMPLETGVNLHGRLSFEETHCDNRVFPGALDSSLTRQGGMRWGANQLISSEISLVRMSRDVYGVPDMKVGIVATHAKKRTFGKEPAIDVINDTQSPAAFHAIIALLLKTSDLEFPDEAINRGTLLTRSRPATEVTTAPTAHFAFHEALGVPADIVNTARASFSAIVQYMELPYTLPAQSENPQQ